MMSTQSRLTNEEILKIVCDNTGQRINLSLQDLDWYIAVARAAISASEVRNNEHH